MKIDYRKCMECGAIADQMDFDRKETRGSRDSEGFQYEPDEVVYYCPFCRADNNDPVGIDDLFEAYQELKEQGE